MSPQTCPMFKSLTTQITWGGFVGGQLACDNKHKINYNNLELEEQSLTLSINDIIVQLNHNSIQKLGLTLK